MRFYDTHLEGLPALRHGFFGRPGVVIKPESTLARSPTIFLDQMHTNHVHTVDSAWLRAHASKRPMGDGVVTQLPGISLGVLTADCGPLLWFEKRKNIIGACHAGWRGALGGVVENTLSAIKALGGEAQHTCVALGPTIQKTSYPVKEDMKILFRQKNRVFSDFFTTYGSELVFDLPGFLVSKLNSLEIGYVGNLGIDTFNNDFFSWRASFRKGEKELRRNIALIALLEE